MITSIWTGTIHLPSSLKQELCSTLGSLSIFKLGTKGRMKTGRSSFSGESCRWTLYPSTPLLEMVPIQGE